MKYALCALLLFAGCRSGSGSDIGPSFSRYPAATCKVLVLDDQGRGVTEAKVTIAGSGATTGASGRAEIPIDPQGPQLIAVDGTMASATSASALPALVFAEDLPGGELPYPVYLPDTSPSVGLVLATGTQSAPQVLDDTANSGAMLQIASGASVGNGGAASVTLRTASLQQGHLPGRLPVAASGAFVLGGGTWIEPAGLTIAAAADLSVVDDLGLGPTDTALLFHLDPVTGSWQQVAGVSATSSGGRLTATTAVAAGGLYCFGSAVTATAQVTGHILNTLLVPVVGVQVTAGEQRTRSLGDGSFTLGPIASTRVDGSARNVTVTLHGGRLFLPIGTTATAALSSAITSLDTGTLSLPTYEVALLRVQQVYRGRILPLTKFCCSHIDAPDCFVGISDSNGRVDVEDFPVRWFGFAGGMPVDNERVNEVILSGFLELGRNVNDVFEFFGETFWFLGGRTSRTFALDVLGTGPIRGAAVVKGTTDDAGFVDVTREGGVVFAERAFEARATATAHTTVDGRDTISAFSIVEPNGEHLSMPLERARRDRLATFDRHGLAAGSLVGADNTRDHRLRTTRRITLSDWFDDVFLARPIVSALPLKVDPATPTVTSFVAGVALPAGNLAAVEALTAGPVFTVQKLGIAADVAVAEATTTALDLPLDLPANTSFAAPGTAAGLDPAIAGAGLAFDLALERPNGLVVDVVRGVNGNHVVSGNDVTFQLPALSGAIASHRWLLAFGGSAVSGSSTIAQKSLLRLTGVGDVGTAFQGVPDITAPAAGATVPPGGFTVTYTVPPGTFYTSIEVRSTDATSNYVWQVLLPPNYTVCYLPRLPAAAHNPLISGRTYTLTVTSYRADLSQFDPLNAYRDLTSYLLVVDSAERGITALGSRSITVTVN